MLRWLTMAPWVVPVTFAALFVGVMWFGLWRDRRKSVSEALAKARVQQQQQVIDSLARVSATHDTIYRVDTVRVRHTRTVFRAVVDSLIRTDTLTVREAVIVMNAESALAADSVALRTAEQRVADREAQLAALQQQRRNEAALARARLAKATPRLMPYVEGLTNPFDTQTFVARGGLTLRLFGSLSLVAAGELTTTEARPLVGVRWNLR